ncbi:MAG: helix-turn-helix transcriptional regulator [Chloroflexota bacterium]
MDQTGLALRIGTRIRAARLAASLTQQQLAEGRYTKAYISALEQGHAKPSMAALEFIADRLGLPPSAFLGRDDRWARLEADLLLASGEWRAAAEALRALLGPARDRGTRAELLVALAEALCRLEQGREAVGAAAEAHAAFCALGRDADAILAAYWLAYARFQTGDATGAQQLLRSLLDDPALTSSGDLRVRVLMALGAVATDLGDHAAAADWLDAARALADDLDDRRRASLLAMIATGRAAAGDVDGAVRAGVESLALYRSAEARREAAVIENNLAMAWLQAGDLERARGYAADARRRHELDRDRAALAHVADTEACIALAGGAAADALRSAREAEALARASGNDRALADALVTVARSLEALGHAEEAVDAYGGALAVLRAVGGRPGLRATLMALADLLATLGRHREAFELTREALAMGGPGQPASGVRAAHATSPRRAVAGGARPGEPTPNGSEGDPFPIGQSMVYRRV